jgi:hypothetical protein
MIYLLFINDPMNSIRNIAYRCNLWYAFDWIIFAAFKIINHHHSFLIK